MINFFIPYSLFKLLEEPHSCLRHGAPTCGNERAINRGCLPRKRDVLAHLHPSNKYPFFVTKWFLFAQSKSDVHAGALRGAKPYHSKVPRRPIPRAWGLQCGSSTASSPRWKPRISDTVVQLPEVKWSLPGNSLHGDYPSLPPAYERESDELAADPGLVATL